MPLVKVGDSWKEAKPYVNVLGNYQEVSEIWNKIDNAWVRVWEKFLPNLINVDSAYPFDGATKILENTTSHYKVSTDWAGTGLIIPVSLHPYKAYELTVSIEIEGSGLDVVETEVYNVTKDTYIVQGLNASMAGPGVQKLVGRFSTGAIDSTDLLEIGIVQSDRDGNSDNLLVYKVYKDDLSLHLA